jgi:hypothetical protein
MGDLVERVRLCLFEEGKNNCLQEANYKKPRCREDYEKCKEYQKTIKSEEIIN